MVHQPSRRSTRRGEDGFTLIELLVVIIILGILSSVVVFAVRGVGDKGQSSALAIDAKTVRTAQEAYCAKFSSYGTMEQLVAEKFLSEPSTNSAITLTSGGPCGTGPASGFSLSVSSVVIKVAANADQWRTSDTGSDYGYSSSAFVYPLNSNLNEPLLIMTSGYDIVGGLAESYERIPVGTNRNTVAGTPGPSALPSTPTAYPTCGGIADRPFCNDTWRFHLRQGVKFHNGQPFDADDVMWTWRDRQPLSASPSSGENTLRFTRALTSATGCTNATSTCPWDSVEKIDQFTVDFTPGIQNRRFPEQVLHPKGAIAPVLRDGAGNPMLAPALEQTPGLSSPRYLGRHLDGSTDGLPAGTFNFGVAGSPAKRDLSTVKDPQGTGPFQCSTTDQCYKPTVPQGGGTASFVANPNYWGPKAQVKGMDYTFIADPAVRTAGLKSGQYDMAIDLNPLDVADIETNGRAVIAPRGQNALIYVNKVVADSGPTPDMTRVGPQTPANYRFNIGTDPAVRKAASLAIDRNAIVTSIFNGNAAPGRLMSPPGILGTYQNLVPPMATNAVLARATLDTAGWTCANGGPQGAPGAGTPCAANETRKWNGPDISKFATGRELKLYMVGISLVPQTEYDLLAQQMKGVGINLITQRGNCDGSITCPDGSVGRGFMYNSSLWDFDLELPNQNDANASFLPVLRQACSNQTGNFRFAPADGTNGVTAPVNNAGGGPGSVFPFGNTPCTGPGAVLGAMDTIWVPQSAGATSPPPNQEAAANMMDILSNQDKTNIVIPVVAQGRIYGMSKKLNLGDPHPSQTSQRWVSLTLTA